MMVAVSASPWGRSARPAIWMMSITDSLGEPNSTESMAGTSTPSPRQRALATTDQPPSGGCRSRSSTSSRWALVMPPCTCPADTGPSGRCRGGSSRSVAGRVRANWRDWSMRGRNASVRRSPNRAAVIASAACAAAIRSGIPPSATNLPPSWPLSSSLTWESVIPATTSR
jgi:hypothetical protein